MRPNKWPAIAYGVKAATPVRVFAVPLYDQLQEVCFDIMQSYMFADRLWGYTYMRRAELDTPMDLILW